jgi:hypothetical protein
MVCTELTKSVFVVLFWGILIVLFLLKNAFVAPGPFSLQDRLPFDGSKADLLRCYANAAGVIVGIMLVYPLFYMTHDQFRTLEPHTECAIDVYMTTFIFLGVLLIIKHTALGIRRYVFKKAVSVPSSLVACTIGQTFFCLFTVGVFLNEPETTSLLSYSIKLASLVSFCCVSPVLLLRLSCLLYHISDTEEGFRAYTGNKRADGVEPSVQLPYSGLDADTNLGHEDQENNTEQTERIV